MDALTRIRELLTLYNWSMYKLAVKADIPQSTLSNMFNRNNQPSLQTLEQICKGFGISLSEFFCSNSENADTSYEQAVLLAKYNRLTDEQKTLVLGIIDNFK